MAPGYPHKKTTEYFWPALPVLLLATIESDGGFSRGHVSDTVLNPPKYTQNVSLLRLFLEMVKQVVMEILPITC